MITPIGINYNYSYNYKSPVKPKVTTPTFKAHPEFDELKQNYDITASSYFRRGGFYGSVSPGFLNIVDVFEDMFGEDSAKPKKMLIVGIGNSQEPFSYLSVINNMGEKSLSKKLDLYTVDMQSKPEKSKLFADSFYDGFEQPPMYAKDGFIEDPDWYKYKGLHTYHNRKYRVKDDIFNYLNKTYNNPAKSQWDTRIQDVIEEYPDNSFDVISANNTIGYMREREDISKTFDNIYRVLKPGGLFITDTYYFDMNNAPQRMDNMKEIFPGIYRVLYK